MVTEEIARVFFEGKDVHLHVFFGFIKPLSHER